MSDSESNNININDILYSFFSYKTIELLYSFLAIYFTVYLIIKLFYDTSANQNDLPEIRAKILNLMIFGILLFQLLNSYFSLNDDGQKRYLRDNYYKLKNFIDDKASIFSVISFILGFYLCVYFLEINMEYGKKPTSISFIDSSMWILFIILLINDFFSIFFKISIIDLFDTSFLKIKLTVNDVSGEIDFSANQQDEVFNISNNLYTYEDAPAVCSIYGAKVATYDQIENAYNKGGEWCNYGWSDGQMALFPTQKSTWNLLQGSEETKNNCGRPGINGGYMENPNILFGVNCFGKKPSPTDKDLAFMNANKEINIPKTESDIIVNKKAEIWKNNPDLFLNVHSFNRNHWND
jgi:hypothetical protein